MPTRTYRQGERQLARVDVAVGRQEGRTEHARGRHRREELLRLVGRDELERQTKGLRPTGLARELLQPFLGGREPNGPDLVPAGLEADLVAEGSVELDRAHHHLRQAERATELAHQARRMERRPTRELRALA